MNKLFHLQTHPQRHLQMPWHWVQIGLLLFPFSPLLGGLSLLGAAIATWIKQATWIKRRPFNRGLAVLSLWFVVAAIFAYDRTAALLGLANFLPLFFLFTALSTLIQTPAQLRQLAWVLVLTSVPVVIIGLGQQFWGWAGHLRLLGIIVDLGVERGGNPLGRMSSIFAYANVLANYLVIAFILAIGLWIDAFPGRRSQSQSIAEPAIAALSEEPYPALNASTSSSIAWGRWCFLAAVVLGNAIALLLTNSRNAWVLAGLACLTYALYLGWRWLVIAVGIAVTGIGGAAFGPAVIKAPLRLIVPAFLWARLSDELYPNRPVATLRATQWQFAWSLAEQRPFTGWGLRNFTPLYQAKWQVFMGHPHSLPLMLMAETGVFATLLLVGLVGWMVYRGVRLFLSWNPASDPLQQSDRLILFTYLVAFLACSLFNLFDVTLFDIRINVLGWLLLAAICGLVERQQAGARNFSEEPG
ncbi:MULTISPECIES: O-antigen ligase [Trichocoleus]|uniref:O-antigen ligase family protein n=1 Tax=Trichocoleus desertorum GB2-A4 TaxID=2933944 RepID=A0ABV0J2F0_9CYAN|nr:O-antigen ligase family protein [Trichocoleus sp. FACHB-46]